MPTQFKFTRRSIDALKAVDRRQQYRDTECRGLVLTVYPTGKKTFYKRRSIGNRDEAIRLGDYSPAFGPDDARKAAAAFDVEIDQGRNVAAARRALREEPTFGETFADYLTSHRTKSGRALGYRTQVEYQRIVNLHLEKLVPMKPSQIDANLAKAVLRAIKSEASMVKAATIISVTMDHSEPGKGKAMLEQIKAGRFLPKVAHRERYMTDDETARFMAALESNPLKDFFLIALLTGQRRSNVQAMRWADLDLEKGRWVIDRSEFKTGRTHTVDLTPEAVEILKARRNQTVLGLRWVFPADSKTGHLVEPRKAWERLLREAGIEGLRIHDLRHTLASWLINSGNSIDVVGRALGHKSNAASRIYAHLTRETVGNAVATVTADKLKSSR